MATLGSLIIALKRMPALSSRSWPRKPTSGLSASVFREACSDMPSVVGASERFSVLIAVFVPFAGMRNASVSAIRAGLSDPSTSRVFLVFMIACPPSLGSTPARTTRRRTRAPAGTGARKRDLVDRRS